MKKLSVLLALCMISWPVCASDTAPAMPQGSFLVLSYHAVPAHTIAGDAYSVPRALFVEQMEYLRRHGYQPVSIDDILRARNGEKRLPAKPVLLTFDDAYASYYEFVVPLLERCGFPSILAVVGSFIDNPPEDIPESLMSWNQIKEVLASDLVEVVSHSHDLHGEIQYNPQGNVGPEVNILAYDKNTDRYETENEYRSRIAADFSKQDSLFRRKLGFSPKAIVWPHGKYNSISWDVAQKAGFQLGFTLEWGLGHVSDLRAINRVMVENEPIDAFIERVAGPAGTETMVRSVQVDIDTIYNPESYDETDENLGDLIDRLTEMQVNTVYLQGFSDPEGTGNIEKVYFQNSVLPVEADIFAHVAHQLIIRNFTVYAWMPTLGIRLPDAAMNERLRVRERRDGMTSISQSWYERLTPFSPEVNTLVQQLYEDLASHAQIDGILFQDDAYLGADEDYHPLALSAYKQRFGEEVATAETDIDNHWAEFKTDALIDFTQGLIRAVKKYRPEAKFMRNLYAPMVLDPTTEALFAQSYKRFIDVYDKTVVMAYPQMEGADKPVPWLRELVGKAKEAGDTQLEKTVFKVQAYDWNADKWINDGLLLDEIKAIIAEGGRHVAYYPDAFDQDEPKLSTVRMEMSTRDHPDLP